MSKRYDVTVYGEGGNIINNYCGVVDVIVGSAGELYVYTMDSCVYIYAAGKWSQINTIPDDEQSH